MDFHFLIEKGFMSTLDVDNGYFQKRLEKVSCLC
jgi:hypothetical protein